MRFSLLAITVFSSLATVGVAQAPHPCNQVGGMFVATVNPCWVGTVNSTNSPPVSQNGCTAHATGHWASASCVCSGPGLPGGSVSASGSTTANYSCSGGVGNAHFSTGLCAVAYAWAGADSGGASASATGTAGVASTVTPITQVVVSAAVSIFSGFAEQRRDDQLTVEGSGTGLSQFAVIHNATGTAATSCGSGSSAGAGGGGRADTVIHLN